jgi:YgiT-type zinc finger domain-containing protein
MKCLICKQGETYHGMATVTLERAANTLVFKQVPALVCETCDEEYVAEDVTRILLVHAEEARVGCVRRTRRPPGILRRRHLRALTQHVAVMRASSPFVGLRRA